MQAEMRQQHHHHCLHDSHRFVRPAYYTLVYDDDKPFSGTGAFYI